MPRPTRTLHELPTPALLVDLDVLESNLRAMAERARALGVALRPHVKTHKCVEVAERQRALGARGITVSTLYEARVFAEAGFEDITWAFPLPLSRVGDAARLASRVALGLTVDSPAAVDALEAAGAPFRVWLKVDCGYHRAGVDPRSGAAPSLARRLHESPTLSFQGILSHSGHAYGARSDEEAAAVAEEERAVMAGLAERLRGSGIDVPGVSVGSTPSMTRARDLSGVTEARPGNYAYFDRTQVELGSCAVADCALTVLACVVSAGAGGRAVIDAGALALSKDAGPAWAPSHYGRVLPDLAGGEAGPDLRVSSLSQEHGILDGPAAVGARLRVLPNHSCLTAACFDACHAVRGQEVVDTWTIHRGRD